MKTKIMAVVVLALGASMRAEEATAVNPDEQHLEAAKVRVYFEMREALDSKLKGTDLFWQLQDRYGVHEQYTVREVMAVAEPGILEKKVTVTADRSPTRNASVPAGALKHDDVVKFLGILAERDRAQGKADAQRPEALVAKYGEQPWYTAKEVREIEKNGKIDPQESTPGATLPDPPIGWRPVARGLHLIKIRADWTDLFNADDASQTDTKMPKTLGDLVGAKLGYTRDGVKKTDATTVAGALIIPFTWRNPVVFNSSVPATVTVAPSITINKVSTTGASKDEADYIYGRIGFYGKWLRKSGSARGAILARAAYVHATDTSGHGHLDAGEFDLEMQWLEPGKLSIGYKTVLVAKQPVFEDLSDNSLVDVQLRAWVHGEIGEVQRNSPKWEAVEGDFFRAGPTVQAQVNLPTLFKGVSFTARYSYMQPFRGPDYHNNSMKLSTAFTLSENKTLGQKVSFTVEYTKGSLILTKQYAESMTAGLSIVR
jgi:hypothetical protein